jgi:proteasome lid subunit RPN8/RPN11
MREDAVIRAVYKHAEEEYPKECCGVVTATGHVVPLENRADNPFQSFKVSPQDYLKYFDGAMFAYHSHPDTPAAASDGDRNWVDRYRLPLLIVSWPNGDLRLVGEPGKDRELPGRPFIYGVYDCYSLVEGYYRREYGYALPEVPRPRFGWWRTGEIDPFMDGADRSGLVDVNTPEEGDLMMFQVNSARVTNHCGIYMGNNMILHHQLMSFSTLTEYGEDLRNTVTRILRHVD